MAMAWYSRVECHTRQIIGHFGNDFKSQTIQPPVSQYRRTMVSQPGQGQIQPGSAG